MEHLKQSGALAHTSLHIDAASMNISKATIGGAIRTTYGRICHIHPSDSDQWYPGHTHYDFHETLQTFCGIGYDGALALEELLRPDTHTAAQQTSPI